MRDDFLRPKPCRSALIVLIGALLSLVISTPASASTISRVKIEDLYKEADLVAVVKIVSGDAEHYSDVVYKAEIQLSLKNATRGETIFLGPHLGLAIGGQYLAFLRKSGGMNPQGPAGLGYGIIPTYFRAMYAGFSVMEVEYACVFDGIETRQQCDSGVKLNPTQIILPKKMKVYPLVTDGETDSVLDDATNYHRWARMQDIVSLLHGLVKS